MQYIYQEWIFHDRILRLSPSRQRFATQLPNTRIACPNSIKHLYILVYIGTLPREIHPRCATSQKLGESGTFFLRFFFRSSVPDKASWSVSSLRRFCSSTQTGVMTNLLPPW